MENKRGKPTGQAGRYFKYAIGEVILVMIGILLALQVNTWNVNRLNGLEEERILKDLKEEIGPAITEREQLIKKVDEIRIELAIVLDKLFSSPAQPLNDTDCRSLWRISFQRYNVPDLSVVEELIVSGNISIVKNPELRKQMIAFRNETGTSLAQLRKGADMIHHFPDEYPNLIFRSWQPLTQSSIFICNSPEMAKSKAFLAQLQTDRGRLRGLEFAAESELNYLKKIDSILNTTNK